MGRRKLRKDERKVQLSVKVLPKEVDALDRIASERGVNRADVIRGMLAVGFERERGRMKWLGRSPLLK